MPLLIIGSSYDHLPVVHGVDSVSGHQFRGHLRNDQNQPAFHDLGLCIRESQRCIQSDCVRHQVSRRICTLKMKFSINLKIYVYIEYMYLILSII